jgi:SAM-dependent methyltransferase
VPCHTSVKGYALHACPACKVELLYPQPDESVLAAIYSDHYFLGEQSDEGAERRSRMKSATGALYVDALVKLIRPENAKLLEVGCGHGEVLMEARNRGFAISGIEISPHAAAVANSRLGVQAVQVGSIEEVSLPPGHFDAILAADVIEHVRHPKGFLMRANALLSPGGVVVLITPSLDSWTRRILRSRWMEYKVEHLYYFSAKSMRRLLEGCGFGEIRVFPSRKMLTFDYIARHFDRFRVPLLSPLLGTLRRTMPDRLAYRHLRLPASGLIAVGRKPSIE